MRIGIDIRCLMNGKYSGVGWYAYNLLNALLDIDDKNNYVLFYNSSKPVSLPKFERKNVSFAGFHWPNKLFNLSLNFFGRPKLDELIGGCDIFFAPNLHFVSWSAKCKKIIAVHDLSFLAYPDFFTLKQKLWHKLILNRHLLDQADVIIADSFSTKRDLMELLNIPENKIKVVYLGVNQPLQTKNDSSPLRKGRLGGVYLPEKYFLFVSTIEPRKNLFGIIQAMKDLPEDVCLVVAGERGWKSAGRFLISKKKIKFLGYVNENDKWQLYREAIALVYPSFYEGFGLPILESMAAGCPIIAGNNSSQGEVLADCGLLVDPFNVVEISQAMNLMLTDEKLRQEFISRGLARSKEFSWQKTAREVLEIFENLS